MDTNYRKQLNKFHDAKVVGPKVINYLSTQQKRKELQYGMEF